MFADSWMTSSAATLCLRNSSVVPGPSAAQRRLWSKLWMTSEWTQMRKSSLYLFCWISVRHLTPWIVKFCWTDLNTGSASRHIRNVTKVSFYCLRNIPKLWNSLPDGSGAQTLCSHAWYILYIYEMYSFICMYIHRFLCCLNMFSTLICMSCAVQIKFITMILFMIVLYKERTHEERELLCHFWFINCDLEPFGGNLNNFFLRTQWFSTEILYDSSFMLWLAFWLCSMHLKIYATATPQGNAIKFICCLVTKCYCWIL